MASQVSPGPLVRSSKGIRRVEEAELTICYKLFYFCVVPYNLERLLYPCAVVPEPLMHWEPSMISVLGILIRASQRLPTCPKAHILCYRVRLRTRSSDPWSGSLSTVSFHCDLGVVGPRMRTHFFIGCSQAPADSAIHFSKAGGVYSQLENHSYE